MALCEKLLSNYEGAKGIVEKLFLFLQMLSVWVLLLILLFQTAKHQGQKKRTGGLETNIFELLMLQHDRAYLNVDSEESMCVIIKCCTAIGIDYYTNYVSV